MATAREHSPYSDAVSAEIRAERARQRLTQAQVFEAAGISRSTYLRIEAGKHVVDTTQLGRLCDALGVSMSELLKKVEAEMAKTQAVEAPSERDIRRQVEVEVQDAYLHADEAENHAPVTEE